MGTVIVVLILAVIVVFAVPSSIKHMKGEGSCCGGGTEEEGFFSRFKRKKLDSDPIGELEVQIDGMHCDNCKRSVERAVNELDGAVCKVNLKKGTAVVEYSREVSDEELTQAIEKEGFEVKEIRRK